MNPWHPWVTAPYRPREWRDNFDIGAFDLSSAIANGLVVNRQVDLLFYTFANSWGRSADALVAELNSAHLAGVLGGGPWELRDERPRPRKWTLEEIIAMISRHDFPSTGTLGSPATDWFAVLHSLARLFREPGVGMWEYLKGWAISDDREIPPLRAIVLSVIRWLVKHGLAIEYVVMPCLYWSVGRSKGDIESHCKGHGQLSKLAIRRPRTQRFHRPQSALICSRRRPEGSRSCHLRSYGTFGASGGLPYRTEQPHDLRVLILTVIVVLVLSVPVTPWRASSRLHLMKVAVSSETVPLTPSRTITRILAGSCSPEATMPSRKQTGRPESTGRDDQITESGPARFTPARRSSWGALCHWVASMVSASDLLANDGISELTEPLKMKRSCRLVPARPLEGATVTSGFQSQHSSRRVPGRCPLVHKAESTSLPSSSSPSLPLPSQSPSKLPFRVNFLDRIQHVKRMVSPQHIRVPGSSADRVRLRDASWPGSSLGVQQPTFWRVHGHHSEGDHEPQFQTSRAAQSSAKKSKIRKNKKLSPSDKTRRLEALEDFYEHSHTALLKASSVTMSFMHQTLLSLLALTHTAPADVLLSIADGDGTLCRRFHQTSWSSHRSLGGHDAANAPGTPCCLPDSLTDAAKLTSARINQMLLEAKDRNTIADSSSPASPARPAQRQKGARRGLAVTSSSSFLGYGSSPPTTPSLRRQNGGKRARETISPLTSPSGVATAGKRARTQAQRNNHLKSPTAHNVLGDGTIPSAHARCPADEMPFPTSPRHVLTLAGRRRVRYGLVELVTACSPTVIGPANMSLTKLKVSPATYFLVAFAPQSDQRAQLLFDTGAIETDEELDVQSGPGTSGSLSSSNNGPATGSSAVSLKRYQTRKGKEVDRAVSSASSSPPSSGESEKKRGYSAVDSSPPPVRRNPTRKSQRAPAYGKLSFSVCDGADASVLPRV
ncbi:hypothetical protein P7C70_g4747, partial [Phenoliferia sp. Uapishka_3]